VAGVRQDYVESAKWYRKAAQQDQHAAQLYLGCYLMQGQGVEQNLVEAFKWILLARRGNPMDRYAANENQKKLEAVLSEHQIAEARVMALHFAAEHGE
jgi:TPR repeat protein